MCENESNLCQPIGSDVQPLNTPMVDVGEGHDETWWNHIFGEEKTTGVFNMKWFKIITDLLIWGDGIAMQLQPAPTI